MAYKDKEQQKVFQRLWRRQYRIDQKRMAIEKLGGKCSNCDVTDIRCLEFDHIKPELRKWGANDSFKIIRSINTGNLMVKDIQILCANCHSIKTYVEDRLTFANYIS